jgi:hypothetical protein
MTKEKYKTSSESFGSKLMNTISHVAHIETAVEILRTGCIKSSLVFDESKLNTTRIKVIWLSPNEWVDGYMYGTIRFNFDTNTLFSEDKHLKFYWVEVKEYRNHACRILVTTKEYDYELYDYTNKEEGIWWYDKENKKHYFNAKYTLEIMYEVDEIEVKEHKFIDIVHHSIDKCNMTKRLDNDICLEQSSQSIDLRGARFLNALLLNNLKNAKISPTLVTKKNQISLVGMTFPMFNDVLNKLKDDILKYVPLGSTELEEVANKSLFHAILNCYLLAQIKEMEALAKIFNNKDKFREMLDNVIRNLVTRSFTFNIDKKKYTFDIVNYFSMEKRIAIHKFIYILAHVKYKKLEKNLTYGDIEFYHVDCLLKGSILIEAVNKVKKEKSLTNVNAVFVYKIDEDIDLFKEKIIKKIQREQPNFSN